MSQVVFSGVTCGRQFTIHKEEGKLFAMRPGARDPLPIFFETGLSGRNVSAENIDNFCIIPTGVGYTISRPLPGGARKFRGLTEKILSKQGRLNNWIKENQIKAITFCQKTSVWKHLYPITSRINFVTRSVVSERKTIPPTKLKHVANAVKQSTSLERLNFHDMDLQADSEAFVELIDAIAMSTSVQSVEIREVGIGLQLEMIKEKLSSNYSIWYSAGTPPTLSIFRNKNSAKDALIESFRGELERIAEEYRKTIAATASDVLDTSQAEIQGMAELEYSEFNTKFQLLLEQVSQQVSSNDIRAVREELDALTAKVGEHAELLKEQAAIAKMLDEIRRLDENDPSHSTEIFYYMLLKQITAFAIGVNAAKCGLLERKKSWKDKTIDHLAFGIEFFADLGIVAALGAAAVPTYGATAALIPFTPLIVHAIGSGVEGQISGWRDDKKQEQFDRATTRLQGGLNQMDWACQSIAGAVAIIHHLQLPMLTPQGKLHKAEAWVWNWVYQMLKDSSVPDDHIQHNLSLLLGLNAKKTKNPKIELVGGRKVKADDFNQKSGVCYPNEGNQLVYLGYFDNSCEPKREITDSEAFKFYYFGTKNQADEYCKMYVELMLEKARGGNVKQALSWIGNKTIGTMSTEARTEIIRTYWQWEITDGPSLSGGAKSSAHVARSTPSHTVSESRDNTQIESIIRRIEELEKVVLSLHPGKTWEALVEEAAEADE